MEQGQTGENEIRIEEELQLLLLTIPPSLWEEFLDNMKKFGLMASAIICALLSLNTNASENSNWKDAFFQVMQDIYQNSGGSYGAQLADLDNSGIPELIVYEEQAGGIMYGDAKVYYMVGDTVAETDFVGLEDSYSGTVYCDTYTGEECFLTNADCLDRTEQGNIVDEMVLKTERLRFDGSNAWKETVDDFSEYQGQSYTQDIYDAYQQMKARYRYSDSRKQKLYDDFQGGYTPTAEDMTAFLDSYQYCGYVYQNTTGTEVITMASLLGKTREEVNTSGIIGNETGYSDGDVIYYSGNLYGASGNAYIDYIGEIAQMISIEFVIDGSDPVGQIAVDKIQQELDENMVPINTSDNGDGLYTYTWSDGEIQISLSDALNEGWRMFAVTMYRTEEIAEAGGAFSSWEDAYRTVMYSPEGWLESANGWIFELIDLNQDGTPELVCTTVTGARAVSAGITVFTYRDNALAEVPVENTVDFYGLGGLEQYIYNPTGEVQWLMNLGMFTIDSLIPGSYLESSGGQSGVARLTSNEDCTEAYYSVVVDSARDFGVEAIHAGGIIGKEPWEDGCVTQEAWDKIRAFISQYSAGAEIPEIYIERNDSRDQGQRNELYNNWQELINAYYEKSQTEQTSDTAAVVNENHTPFYDTENENKRVSLSPNDVEGMWVDPDGNRWQFGNDGLMGSAGEYAGRMYEFSEGTLIWHVGDNAQESYNYTVDDTCDQIKLTSPLTGDVENILMRIRDVANVNNVCDRASTINPVGSIDELSSGKGFIYVGGWCYDPDSSADSLEVHVYIGGPTGTGTFYGPYLAANYREDIGDNYGVGYNHGISPTIKTNLAGQQDVYVYAINRNQGENTLIGYGSVYIQSTSPEVEGNNSILDREDVTYENDSISADDQKSAPEKDKAVSVENTSIRELSDLFGTDLEETARNLGLSTDAWYMMVDVRKRDDEKVRVAQIWNYSGINKIWLSDTNEFTLDGINPLMSRDEMIEFLKKKGYQETIQEDIWRKDSYFFDISADNGISEKTAISLEVIRPLAPEGRTEVSGYIGKKMTVAVNDFGGDAAVIDNEYVLKSDGIWFYGKTTDGSSPSLNDTDSIVITKVEILGVNTQYCIYGVIPGMTEETVSILGMERGGPGELIDPMNNILFWGGVNRDNGRLSLFYNEPIAAIGSTDEDNNESSSKGGAFDLAQYIGNDYAVLFEGLSDIEILEEREDETKLGNETLSVSARKDRVITRIGIREGSNYTAEDIGAGMDSEAVEQKLQEKGYSNTDVRMDDDRSIYWKIYENREKGMFFAYRHVGNTCDAVYCGLKDYMPF